MNSEQKVALVIVSFRNPDDLCACLKSLESCGQSCPFQVFICENGGSDAYSATIGRLREAGYPILDSVGPDLEKDSSFVGVTRFALPNANTEIHYGQAKNNLGYAGGINSWIRLLKGNDKWLGYWILNPDTVVFESTLENLVSYARSHSKGMVGSRLLRHCTPEFIFSRGLKWSPFWCRTLGMDNNAPASLRPERSDIEKRIDSPSGASFYVTPECLNRIGLMDDSYFLYFEDLDWGLRAKKTCGVGYAYDSVVSHVGGSTLGSASNRRSRSALAVYLDFRNRLLFVRRNYPGWLPWTILMVLARSFEFLAIGAFTNFSAALGGWRAGVLDETGPPERLLSGLSKK